LKPLKQVVQQTHLRRDGETDEAWDQRVRSKYVDVARFLLPAASLANLGMTANARTLEHAIRKMLSHPLQEVREIGETVREVAQLEAPTLVKYAEPMVYTTSTLESIRSRTGDWPVEKSIAGIELIDYDPEAEDRVLAAALYSEAGTSFQQAFKTVSAMDKSGKDQLASELLASMDRHDAPLRALEHAVYTFDVCLDQGAYFELKRHRMMTQTPQPLQTDLGYAVPRLFREADFERQYREVMDAAGEAFQAITEWNPHVAAYVVPNGYNRRVLITLNLREVFHLCELRARSNAHFSIRRMALQIADSIQQVHPHLSRHLRMPEDVTWQDIDSEYFIEV
jgi:thymidylate synthase ThyX